MISDRLQNLHCAIACFLLKRDRLFFLCVLVCLYFVNKYGN
ncbi:MAG: hypothetical protein V7K79_27725 [Nostoc sp.]